MRACGEADTVRLLIGDGQGLLIDTQGPVWDYSRI